MVHLDELAIDLDARWSGAGWRGATQLAEATEPALCGRFHDLVLLLGPDPTHLLSVADMHGEVQRLFLVR